MTREPAKNGKLLVRIAPPLIALAILAAVIYAAGGPAMVAERMAAGEPLRAAPFAFVLAFTFMLLQSFWDRRLLAVTPRAPSWIAVLSGKAATAMLVAVGPLAGGGGYAAWIARATGAGIALGAAMAVLISLSDFGALGVIAALIALTGTTATVPTPAVVFAFAAPAAVVILFSAARLLSVRLKGSRLSALAALPLKEILIQIGGRSVAISCAVVFTSLGARAFGLDVPFDSAIRVMPLLLFVGVLPVNLAGFGAVQAAWVMMLSPWAAAADVVAFHMSWALTMNLAFITRGLPFMRRALRDAGLESPSTTS